MTELDWDDPEVQQAALDWLENKAFNDGVFATIAVAGGLVFAGAYCGWWLWF